MATPKRFEFVLNGATPADLSLDRLSAYAQFLHELFDGAKGVTLKAILKGSAKLAFAATPDVEERVLRPLRLIQGGMADGVALWIAPPEPDTRLAAQKKINRRLADDGYSAVLRSSKGENIIAFPGAKMPLAQEARVHEAVELRAQVLRVGGKDESVPVLLRTAEFDVRAQTNRAIAKELAKHLFGDDVIVHGDGTWLRDADGKWTLESVALQSWRVAEPEDGADAFESTDAMIKAHRAIGGNGWDDFADPLAELRRLRQGEA